MVILKKLKNTLIRAHTIERHAAMYAAGSIASYFYYYLTVGINFTSEMNIASPCFLFYICRENAALICDLSSNNPFFFIATPEINQTSTCKRTWTNSGKRTLNRKQSFSNWFIIIMNGWEFIKIIMSILDCWENLWKCWDIRRVLLTFADSRLKTR